MSPTVKDTSEVRNGIHRFPPDAASAVGLLSGFAGREAQASTEWREQLVFTMDWSNGKTDPAWEHESGTKWKLKRVKLLKQIASQKLRSGTDASRRVYEVSLESWLKNHH